MSADMETGTEVEAGVKGYYGIINLTRRHRVSTHWKEAPPSIEELLAIIEERGWSETDFILVASLRDDYQYRDGKLVASDEETATQADILDTPDREWEEFGVGGEKFDPAFFCTAP